jgi:hypothetical protein
MPAKAGIQKTVKHSRLHWLPDRVPRVRNDTVTKNQRHH